MIEALIALGFSKETTGQFGVLRVLVAFSFQQVAKRSEILPWHKDWRKEILLVKGR